jgi:hypothetical protein
MDQKQPKQWKTEYIEYYDQNEPRGCASAHRMTGHQADIIAHVISPGREMPMMRYVGDYCLHVVNHPF